MPQASATLHRDVLACVPHEWEFVRAALRGIRRGTPSTPGGATSTASPPRNGRTNVTTTGALSVVTSVSPRTALHSYL